MNIQGPSKFIQKIYNASKLRLFLDYDGTLSEFAPTPDDVHPDPELIRLLTQLKSLPKIQIAIISGRRLSHICKLLPISGIILAGTYGLEMMDAMGKQIQRVGYQKTRPWLEELKPQWSELIRPQEGFYLEDKGWSLAIHAKDAETVIAEKILRQAKENIFNASVPLDLFRILGGHKFLEIAPNLANKGLTIDYIISNYPLEGSLPVYIGDDDKDEEAIENILRYDGVAIKVCQQPCNTKAQLRLSTPSYVRQFLTSLLNEP